MYRKNFTTFKDRILAQKLPLLFQPEMNKVFGLINFLNLIDKTGLMFGKEKPLAMSFKYPKIRSESETINIKV